MSSSLSLPPTLSANICIKTCCPTILFGVNNLSDFQTEHCMNVMVCLKAIFTHTYSHFWTRISEQIFLPPPQNPFLLLSRNSVQFKQSSPKNTSLSPVTKYISLYIPWFTEKVRSFLICKYHLFVRVMAFLQDLYYTSILEYIIYLSFFFQK